MAKRVLFVAYYFPPMGGAGVQRSVKFVRYLPEFGWSPVVVTADMADYEVTREFQLDDALAAELGGPVPIHRVGDPRSRGLLKKLDRSRLFKYAWFAAYPRLWEAQAPWSRAAARACIEIARREKVDLVYTSLAPFSASLAGYALRSKLGIPWVADLRDLWTEDALRVWPSRSHFRWERRLERRMLSTADRVVANTDLSKAGLCEALGLARDRVDVIPNGYAAADFADATPRPDPSHFVLTHIGAFRDYTRDESAPPWPLYAPVRTSERARSPLYVFRAIHGLLKENPSIAERLRVRLVGFLSDANRRLIDDLGLQQIVEETGYVPHREIAGELLSATALLLLQVAFADPERPVPYVPGKMYEYFAARKPILAPLPPGDARRMAARSGLAYPAPHNDPKGIGKVLGAMMKDWEAGDLTVRPDEEYIRAFERERLTRSLADVFDTVTGKGGAS